MVDFALRTPGMVFALVIPLAGAIPALRLVGFVPERLVGVVLIRLVGSVPSQLVMFEVKWLVG